MPATRLLGGLLRPGRSFAISYSSTANLIYPLLRPGSSYAISYTSYTRSIYPLLRKDIYDSGHGYIAGIVEQEGTPIGNRRVRLFDQVSGRFLRETISADDGSFEFDYIALNRVYIILSEDPTGNYDVVAHDNIQSISMN